MADQAYLLFPLAAAMLYSLAAYLLKGAQRRGITALQTTFYANLITAVIFFAIFHPWGEPDPWPSNWLHVLWVGIAFFVGGVCTIVAFEQGAVSIATPMLGSKVILVAFIVAVVVGQDLLWTTWLAAFLTTLGVVLLARSMGGGAEGSATAGIVLALLASVSFAAFDVMVQEWSPVDGFGRLIPPAMILATIMSLGLAGRSPRTFFHITKRARRPLVLGSMLMASQAVLLIWSIGHFGDAAGANVVYGSRGVWTVLLVGFLGRWITSVEVFHSRAAFAERLLGAVVICGAIAALVLGPIVVG